MSDLKQIVKNAIKGKRKAQSELYDRFCGLVMGICMRYAKNEDEAEDFFQEVFIKIFQNLEKIQDAEALPGYIRKIAISTALDEIKKQKIQWMTPVDQENREDDQYAMMLERLSSQEIIKIINKLPNGYRAVFNMSVIDGFAHKEIAEVLQISESTSRSQLTYAKRLLKEKLKKAGITRYESVI